ncbi:biotin/lipoyl-binding protein, partial [Dissulfurirhabdus thermomarina]
MPAGEVKVLQPLTTGVVREIRVREGDFVHAGDVLMEIDPSDTAPELESMRADLQRVELDIARLRALLE